MDTAVCRYCFKPLEDDDDGNVRGVLGGWVVWYCTEQCKRADGRKGSARADVVDRHRVKPGLLDRDPIPEDPNQMSLFE